jgi:iron complex outermembrane recepter protein
MTMKECLPKRLVRTALFLSMASATSLAHAQAAEQPAAQGSDTPVSSGEIIVTALKQASSLQRTPAAISVVSGDDLVKRQMTDIRSLNTFVPSVKTNVEATATQFFVRGVGKQVDQARIPDAVAMVVDGLTIPQQASGLSLFDVRSIEVLPGPQGTLYGSSAIGGVVNITTNRPTPNLESSLLLEGGNYGTVHATAIQNIPISDGWSIRGVYNGSYHGGYNNNGTYDDNMTAFRLSSLYQPPGSDFTFFLTGTYAFDHFRLSPTVPFPYLNGKAYDIAANDPATAFFYPPNGLAGDIPRVRMNVGTITTQIDWRLGDVTVSYMGGYLHRGQPTQNIQSVAGFLETYSTQINEFNNELRISNSTISRLKWIAGLYQSSSRNHEQLIFGPNLSGQNYVVRQKTYAAYGQATFSFTDHTRLTGGVRVSQDRIDMSNGEVFYPTGAPPNFDRGVIPFSFHKKWNRLNWKAGIEQDLGSRSMLYAAVQSGFNPGTFDGNAPDPGREVKPQTMVGYTAGIKNRFLDSRLTLNLEGYYYSYKDQIITAPDLVTGQTALLNAPRSRIYGVQLDTALDVLDHTRLHANVGYLNATFRRFVAGSASGPIDYSGFALAFSPKFTANLGLNQTIELGDKGSLDARVDSYLSSSYWFTYDHPAGLKQGSYSKTDASLTYHPPSGDWEVGVWCKNLENRAVAASAGSTAGRPYPGVVYVEPPRTYGVRFAVKFEP